MVRLFIAIPIPEEVRAKIKDLVRDLESVRGLPKNIRFAPAENWHFTLTFLGYQDELVVPAVKKSLTSILASDVNNNIEIQFEKLTYGPPGRTPRMVWLTTTKATSATLGRIKDDIEKELLKSGVKWRRENRPYQAHLTLARFPAQSAEDLPTIEQDVNWEYTAGEINLMKSTLKRTGAEYEIL